MTDIPPAEGHGHRGDAGRSRVRAAPTPHPRAARETAGDAPAPPSAPPRRVFFHFLSFFLSCFFFFHFWFCLGNKKCLDPKGFTDTLAYGCAAHEGTGAVSPCFVETKN